MSRSRLSLTLDLEAPGRQVGDLMLRWSDNSNPLGYHPVPVISLKGAPGPTVLITGGNHGDEFEGPAAMMRLAGALEPAELTGQVILMPALNAPAFTASSRVSPLDGANLNRAFPGDSAGGPTAMIADFVEQELLPRCAGAIDLHSGGRASFFAPCALASQSADPALRAANLDLARAFGLPLIWELGAFNDSRSLNGAAERAGVPMIATELGGGGGVDPEITDATERGLRAALAHLGLLDGAVDPVPARRVEITSPTQSVYAPGSGVFDRAIRAGQEVQAGDLAGWFHFVMEPERPSIPCHFPADGFVLAHTCRGHVTRGEMLAIVAQDVEG
ncbi:MAG: succinylglutamate desuccinylase/aspartoacylase family protein [Silicimonas sp.]|nr:succinylglutamate desuccinylase/aspartoacylase family protein [Silicimonas sp.]